MFAGALVSIHGPGALPNSSADIILAAVDANTTVPRGTYDLQVNSTESLAVGDVVTLAYRGGNNSMAAEM